MQLRKNWKIKTFHEIAVLRVHLMQLRKNWKFFQPVSTRRRSCERYRMQLRKNWKVKQEKSDLGRIQYLMQLRKNWKVVFCKGPVYCGYWCNSERIERHGQSLAVVAVLVNADQRCNSERIESYVLYRFFLFNFLSTDATQKELKEVTMYCASSSASLKASMQLRKNWKSIMSGFPAQIKGSTRCNSERIESFSSKPRRPLVVYDLWDATQKESKEYVSKLFLFPGKRGKRASGARMTRLPPFPL